MNIFQVPDLYTSTDYCEVQIDGGYISETVFMLSINEGEQQRNQK